MVQFLYSVLWGVVICSAVSAYAPPNDMDGNPNNVPNNADVVMWAPQGGQALLNDALREGGPQQPPPLDAPQVLMPAGPFHLFPENAEEPIWNPGLDEQEVQRLLGNI